jgi:hypothetical protein
VTLTIERYQPAARRNWDTFVQTSKNGTFLFLRDYMDYHRNRLDDYSLVVRDGSEILVLFPANRSDADVHSHQGLTYGGLVTSTTMTTPRMLMAFDALVEHLKRAGVRQLFYKSVPTIYHRLPAEEDRYALFLADAELYRRDVLSVAPAGARASLQTRRRRGAAKAEKHGIDIQRSEDWPAFWALLSGTLAERFGAAPVHSLIEIERLGKTFPDNISLYVARRRSETLAGVVIYESTMVAHAQYIAASEGGRETGALDRLFLHLLEGPFADKPFFDFGSSNEQEGRTLNRGLIDQKEGFGARAVMHDFYRLRL